MSVCVSVWVDVCLHLCACELSGLQGRNPGKARDLIGEDFGFAI